MHQFCEILNVQWPLSHFIILMSNVPVTFTLNTSAPFTFTFTVTVTDRVTSTLINIFFS